MNLLKRIGPWMVSAALCLMAVEVLGAVMFYLETRSLVYFNSPRLTAAPDPEAGWRHLHPYFGYTGPYSVRGGPTVNPTNNLGFIDSQTLEVPFKPAPNDFVVFVFGSSIAARLVNSSMRGPSLQQALQKLPQLAGRNVVLYNMSQGPAKQPQQLMALAFLLALGQHIDLVLNLDGTLEFVSGMSNFENGIDPIFPPADILLAIGNELAPPDTSSADYYELAYGVSHARAQSKRYLMLLDSSTSGIGYVKNRFFKAFYDHSLESKLRAYAQAAGKAAGTTGVRKRLGLDMTTKSSRESIVQDIFNIWLRCSDLMKVMANSSGATYLNIVLPSPHGSKKTLTDVEKAILFTPETKFIRQSSAAGHAEIERHADMLKSHGIVLATGIFDKIPDDIYVDASGHLGKLGETMLADFVAEQVGSQLARR